MSKIQAVILAAGAGTRMKSNKPKVIHPVLDQAMVQYVIDAAKEAGASQTCVVVGHEKEQVMADLGEAYTYVEQKEQLGTGHAVRMAKDFICDDSQVYVLFGDTPLITGKTLKALSDFHNQAGHGVSVLSTKLEDPTGYGRIIRDQEGAFIKSVEDKDANPEERLCQEINSGMYLFNGKELKEALASLTKDNAQGEYYLPDTLTYILEQGLSVDAMETQDTQEILGVNNRVQLAQATRLLQERINRQHMLDGVTILAPDQVFISKKTVIESDVTLYPGTVIEGESVIASDAVIGPHAHIVDSQIGRGTKVTDSTILDSQVGDETTVGPYAYIRPHSTIGNSVKIGDFVEVKNATIGHKTKVSHLTYIGDADVGQEVNFGCGTVVVNYDGVKKHRTTIDDHAFIGCNTNLVSPVHVKANAYTAAGSTITKDVPEDALAIARSKQKNKLEWVKRKRS